MNPLHLLWIIPLSAILSVLFMAIVKGGDCDPPWYDDVI